MHHETKPEVAPPAIHMIELTVQIAVAYLAHNPTKAAEVPAIMRSIHQALKDSSSPPVKFAQKLVPAVPVNESITPGYIVCLEDGKKLKMLKRHLWRIYQMTPNEYRQKWDLAPDYPMTAPEYSAHRSASAKAIGLGRRYNAPADEVGLVKRKPGRPKNLAAGG